MNNQIKKTVQSLINKVQQNVIYDMKIRKLLDQSIRNRLSMLAKFDIQKQTLTPTQMASMYSHLSTDQKKLLYSQVTADTGCDAEMARQYFMTRFSGPRSASRVELLTQVARICSQDGVIGGLSEVQQKQLRAVVAQEDFRRKLQCAVNAQKEDPSKIDSNNGKPKAAPSGEAPGEFLGDLAAIAGLDGSNCISSTMHQQYVATYAHLMTLYGRRKNMIMGKYQDVLDRLNQYKQAHDQELVVQSEIHNKLTAELGGVAAKDHGQTK